MSMPVPISAEFLEHFRAYEQLGREEFRQVTGLPRRTYRRWRAELEEGVRCRGVLSTVRQALKVLKLSLEASGLPEEAKRAIKQLAQNETEDPPAETAGDPREGGAEEGMTTAALAAGAEVAPGPRCVGREEEVKQIARYWEFGAAVAVYGLGGVGKTTLAREYAEQRAADFKEVLWVHADRPLELEFQRLAARLNLIPHFSTPRFDAERAIGELNGPKKRLLVLDQAPDEQTVRPWIPSAGGCRTLVTSRFANWATVPAFAVGVLPPEPARELLLRRSGRREETDGESADRLADELGHLPLALEQAAQGVLRLRIDVSQYRREYARCRRYLLAWPVVGGQAVATTWLPTVARLGPLARAVLRAVAFLGVTDIPLWLIEPGKSLLFAAGGSPPDVPLAFAVRHAVAELAEHSLVAHRGDGFGLHPLVQAAQAEALDADGRAAGQALATDLLIAAFSERTAAPGDWLEYLQLQDAVDFARLTHAPPRRLAVLHLEVANLSCRKMNNFDVALAHYNDGIRLLHCEGPLAPTTEVAQAVRRRGDVLRMRGDAAAARHDYAVAEELLVSAGDTGAELGKLLSSKADLLTRFAREPADLEEALRVAERSLRIHQLRSDRFEMFQSFRILADVHVALENCREAMNAVEQASQHVAPDHPLVGWLLRTEGEAQHLAGRPADALECFEKALAHFERCKVAVGKAVALHKIALVQADRGEAAAAATAFEQAHQAARGVPGAKYALVQILLDRIRADPRGDCSATYLADAREAAGAADYWKDEFDAVEQLCRADGPA